MKTDILKILYRLREEYPESEELMNLIERVLNIPRSKMVFKPAAPGFSFINTGGSIGGFQQVELTGEETMDKFVDIILENHSLEAMDKLLIYFSELNESYGYRFQSQIDRLRDGYKAMNKQALVARAELTNPSTKEDKQGIAKKVIKTECVESNSKCKIRQSF